jgi:hypothetical protein
LLEQELFVPLYFFGLDEAASPPEQDGEEFLTDEEALKYADLIADDLGQNGSRPRVTVFDPQGRRIREPIQKT